MRVEEHCGVGVGRDVWDAWTLVWLCGEVCDCVRGRWGSGSEAYCVAEWVSG